MTFKLHQGTVPLLVSVPHCGTKIPDSIAHRLTPKALQVEDTDWFLDDLYSVAIELGASFIVPEYSRYTVDLNRPPENTPMYPGSNNTELCPTRFFTGEQIYQADNDPSELEIQDRVVNFWQPYHQALALELKRIKASHGYAVLWDGHSIKSELPWLFDGRLTDLNFGTVNGTSCAASLWSKIEACVRQQSDFDFVLNGRFKGGYITRHYGQPSEGIHAVQLEMVWACYMNESPPFAIDSSKSAVLRPLLRQLLSAVIAWSP